MTADRQIDLAFRLLNMFRIVTPSRPTAVGAWMPSDSSKLSL